MFPSPLQYSSPAVSNAIPQLSCELSHPTHRTACGPFTPSKSEQRSPPLYYRGCWHRVSRDFLCRYCQTTAILEQLSFLPADRSLQPEGRLPPRGVACSHFRALTMVPTAASRRSLDRVSVPVWLIILSDQLPVSLGEPLPHQQADRIRAYLFATGPKIPAFIRGTMRYPNTSGINHRFRWLSRTKRQITHILLTRSPLSPETSLPKN